MTLNKRTIKHSTIKAVERKSSFIVLYFMALFFFQVSETNRMIAI